MSSQKPPFSILLRLCSVQANDWVGMSGEQKQDRTSVGGNFTYTFDDVVVEPRLNQVKVADKIESLTPKTMNVLVYLLEKAPRVIGAEELLDQLWPGRVADDSLIHRRISQIRTVLGDNPRNPRFIATVPKRGYRMLIEPLRNDRSTDGFPFVGRREIMNRFEDFLQTGRDGGQGKVVLLTGAPGIGKSRTAAQFMLRASALDWSVYEAWCTESGIAVPFWPWIRILRRIVSLNPISSITEFETDSHLLYQIVPEVYSDWIETPEPSALDPIDFRILLADTISRILKRLAAKNPLLLFIDDLHKSDEGSLVIFDFIARANAGDRIIMMGSFRNLELEREHPLAEAIANLSRLSGFERIELGGLSAVELKQAGIYCPDMELAEKVIARTDGNPLYATLILQSILNQSITVDLAMPASLREVIIGGLAELSDECYQMLSVAAVVGRHFSIPLLAKISDRRLEQLYPQIEEAQKAGFVSFAANDKPRFTHLLIHETVYEEVPRAQRLALHAIIAEELARVYRGKSETAILVQTADHYRCAAQPIETARWYQKVFLSLINKDRREAYYSCIKALDFLAEDSVRHLHESAEVAIWTVRTTVNAMHAALQAKVHADEVAGLYNRARVLSNRLPHNDPSISLLKLCYSDFLSLSGRDSEALQLARETYEQVSESDDGALRLHSVITLLARLEVVGQLAEARRIAAAQVDKVPTNPLVSVLGQAAWTPYPRIVAFYAKACALMGEPAIGLDYINKAVGLLSKLSYPIAIENIDIDRDEHSFHGVLGILLECLHVGALCFYHLGRFEQLSLCASHFHTAVENNSFLYLPTAHRLTALSLRQQGRWQDIVDGVDMELVDVKDPIDAMKPFDPAALAIAFEASMRLNAREETINLTRTLFNVGSSNCDPEVLIACLRSMIFGFHYTRSGEVEQLLQRLARVIEQTELEANLPFLHELRAQLAKINGDKERVEIEKEKASELWRSVGASAHIRRMNEELDAISSQINTHNE